MELFTNRNFLISLIAFIALVFIMSFLLCLISQLDVYGYDETIWAEIYNRYPGSHFQSDINNYTDDSYDFNKCIIGGAGDSVALNFYDSNNNRYYAATYRNYSSFNLSRSNINSVGSVSYMESSQIGLIQEDVGTFDIPSWLEGELYPVYLDNNETLEVINNYDSVFLKNDVT